jgi:hypothetical protein
VKRSRNNHFLDCEALCAAIGYTLNVQRIPEGIERKTSIEAAVPDGHDRRRIGDAETTAVPSTTDIEDRNSTGAAAFRGRFTRHGSRLNR